MNILPGWFTRRLGNASLASQIRICVSWAAAETALHDDSLRMSMRRQMLSGALQFALAILSCPARLVNLTRQSRLMN